MADIDPFSGGSSFSKPQEKEKKVLNPNTIQLIKKIIIAIIIFAVLGIIVYFLFFNTKEFSFNVKNREGQKISANISIKQINSTKTITINSNETIKLNKSKKYTYNILVNGYRAIRSAPIDMEMHEIPVTLIKEISLKITSIDCPQVLFLGQTVKCEIQLENISTTQDYNTDNLLFEGDVTNWDDFKNNSYIFVDNFGEELTAARKIIGASKSSSVFLEFNVPTDKKYLGNKKISARVAYTDISKDTNFNVQETPNIDFTSNISNLSKIVSGEEVTRLYTINNIKNKTALSDIELIIDANYSPTDGNSTEFDVNQVFTLNSSSISVDALKKEEGLITIRIPPTLRKGDIDGNLCLDSPVFAQAKCINFTIKVEEPPNLFEVSISKASETLTYDSNTNTTTEKNIILTINNRNAIPIHINNISIINSTNTVDCNNWFVLPTQYNSTDIPANNNVTPPIVIKGISPTASTANGTKYCALAVEYIHPFLSEITTIRKEIQITVN